MDYTTTCDSPLGELTLGSDGENLIGLWFDGDRHYCGALSEKSEAANDIPVFQVTKRWLDVYFSGRRPDFLPKLLVRGSDFRKRVCEILLTIPYGQVRTYGDIAEQIARERGISRMSAQAIGGAVGHNPISIIIPCHRVVGSDGSLTGYGGGMERKVKLLELERADLSNLYVPR